MLTDDSAESGRFLFNELVVARRKLNLSYLADCALRKIAAFIPGGRRKENLPPS